jgi:hypothetical protein
MPTYGAFGKKEKRRRRMDKVAVPSTWIKLIKEAQHAPPFEVVYLKHPVTDDMQNDGTPVVDAYNFKEALDPIIRPIPNLARLGGAIFGRGTLPKVRETMSIMVTYTTTRTILKKGQKSSVLQHVMENLKLNAAFRPIKREKLQDVRHLLQHIVIPETVTFYDALYASDEVPHDSLVEKE